MARVEITTLADLCLTRSVTDRGGRRHLAAIALELFDRTFCEPCCRCRTPPWDLRVEIASNADGDITVRSILPGGNNTNADQQTTADCRFYTGQLLAYVLTRTWCETQEQLHATAQQRLAGLSPGVAAALNDFVHKGATHRNALREALAALRSQDEDLMRLSREYPGGARHPSQFPLARRSSSVDAFVALPPRALSCDEEQDACLPKMPRAV